MRAQWLQHAQAEISRQREKAQSKVEKQYHWGNVGYIELAALEEIENAIYPFEQDVYNRRAAMALEELSARWKARMDDPDGYGQGTVWAVLKAVKPSLTARRSTDPPWVSYVLADVPPPPSPARKPWYKFW
jgi:hypothetical protein